MPNPILKYPLDLTGQSPDNLVSGEIHTLPNRQYRILVPKNGYYFSKSMKVYDNVNARFLTRDIDFTCVEMSDMATEMTGSEICRVVIIITPSVSNNVSVTYQVLGGEYSYSGETLLEMLNTLKIDERPVAFENIINRPPGYTPTPHLHDIGDLYGFEYLVMALEAIRRALDMGDNASHVQMYEYIDSHLGNKNQIKEQFLRYQQG